VRRVRPIGALFGQRPQRRLVEIEKASGLALSFLFFLLPPLALSLSGLALSFLLPQAVRPARGQRPQRRLVEIEKASGLAILIQAYKPPKHTHGFTL
jgi:hypothetical protein